MLEPWALDHKAWKKSIALKVFQRKDLETAKVLIATSAQEREHFREFGLTQPIALIPNGIQVKTTGLFSTKPDSGSTARTALFLSDPQEKGVD